MSVGRLEGTCSMYEIRHLFGYATKEGIMKEVNTAIREYYRTFPRDNEKDPPVIIYNHSDRGGSLQVWLDCGFIPMYTYTSPHPGDTTVTHLVYGKVTKWDDEQALKAAGIEAIDEDDDEETLEELK